MRSQENIFLPWLYAGAAPRKYFLICMPERPQENISFLDYIAGAASVEYFSALDGLSGAVSREYFPVLAGLAGAIPR